MISTIGSATLAATRPSSAAPPTATCRVASEPAVEPADYSTIDTAAKAASLPCVNPAMLGVLVAGLVASSFSGGPATAIVNLALGEAQGQLTYTFNPQNPQQAITASGQLGGQNYSETWSLDQDSKKLSLSGQLGETKVDLTAQAGQQGVLVQGSIGEFALTQVLGGEEDLKSITSAGKLGAESFNHDIKIVEDENNNFQMSVNGKIGDQPIEQSVLIARGEDSDMVFQGQGNLAGTSFSMDGKLYTGGRR